MARYRTGYGRAGVSAVVLAEGSDGNAMDVRRVEALLVPASADEPRVVAEGFRGDAAQLQTVRDAVAHVLEGRGLIRLLATPGCSVDAARIRAGCNGACPLGWAATALLIVWTLAGRGSGKHAARCSWRCLPRSGSPSRPSASCTALVTVWRAKREAKEWSRLLDAHQIRLRMDGGLTLIGGSAGLALLAQRTGGDRMERYRATALMVLAPSVGGVARRAGGDGRRRG